ncbi:MAG TPA: cytochrome c [Gemmatimonadaceae bacterium]|nr:cytochrome c [Gemmatimonadaceae bacterium]
MSMCHGARAAIALLCVAVVAGCGDRGGANNSGDAALPADVKPAPRAPERFGSIGRVATPAEVAAWDIDVNPEGKGLPPGRGTYAAGAAVFAQKCASCHGPKGEGIAPNPRLVGRDPREGFPFGQDLKYVKTVGNYWPYATTLYDYIHRAMPLSAPGSLRPDEIYSVVDFLLAENEIIDRSAVMDAKTLPAVRMPAREHFVVDDRRGGAAFR